MKLAFIIAGVAGAFGVGYVVGKKTTKVRIDS